MPGVPETGRSANRLPAVAADPDRNRWFLHRFGQEHDVGKATILAVKGRIVAGPKFPKSFNIFVGDLATSFETRRLQCFEFFFHPTDAQADDDSPVGKHVETRKYLGGKNSVPSRGAPSARAKCDAL